MIGRINFQSSLQLNQKVQANGFVQLNPFKTPLNDTSLITQTNIFVNTLSFNKSGAKWGFDLNSTRNSGKSLLTYGYESRITKEYAMRSRFSFSRSVLLNLNLVKGNARLLSSSKNFDNSNYNIDQYSVEPTVTLTRKANLRLLLGYKYNNKLNAPEYGGDKYSSKYPSIQNSNTIFFKARACRRNLPIAISRIKHRTVPVSIHPWHISFWMDWCRGKIICGTSILQKSWGRTWSSTFNTRDVNPATPVPFIRAARRFGPCCKRKSRKWLASGHLIIRGSP